MAVPLSQPELVKLVSVVRAVGKLYLNRSCCFILSSRVPVYYHKHFLLLTITNNYFLGIVPTFVFSVVVL